MKRPFNSSLILIVILGLSGCQNFISSSEKTSPPFPLTLLSQDSEDSEPTSAQLRLGDRYYLSSVMKSIFGDNSRTKELDDEIFLKFKSDFGHGCEKFGPIADSCGSSPQSSLLGMISPITSSRESLRFRACLYALSSIGTLNPNQGLINAIANTKSVSPSSINLSMLEFPNTIDIQNAYALFFPAEEAPFSVIETLSDLALQVAINENIAEGWRMMFLALCSSPAWQTP